MNPFRCVCLLALTLSVSATLPAATLFGPTPYDSSADSPFAGLGLILEDFQDGFLNSPGVTANMGIVTPGAPGGLVDSVEGPTLWAYYPNASTLRFTFAALLPGGFPTRAGIVWTDVGANSGPTFAMADVHFEAFDPLGISLGTIGPFTLGDGSVTENKADDRFFGVFDAGGISAIEIRMPSSSDWEVDHLQYGAYVSAVPEPATAWLLVGGCLVLILRRSVRA